MKFRSTLWSAWTPLLLVVLAAFQKDKNSVVVSGAEWDVLVQNVGETSTQTTDKTRYYCTFRNLWTEERHPYKYPGLAYWSAPLIFSSTLQYIPWQTGFAVTSGIEKIAEFGFNDVFIDELEFAGEQAYDYAEYSDKWFVNTQSFVHIPPVEVTSGYRYLTSIAAMKPSPDWFTGLYSFWAVDEYTNTWYDHLIIQTYAFDAGTDTGTEYESITSDTLYKDLVKQFNTKNVPDEYIYLNAARDDVLPVAEWECYLHVGDSDLIMPDCDWFNDPCCNETDPCEVKGLLGFGETEEDRVQFQDNTTSEEEEATNVNVAMVLIAALLGSIILCFCCGVCVYGLYLFKGKN